MTYEELVAVVGPDRYRAACEWAWRTAAGTGDRTASPNEWPEDLAAVPHDIGDGWYDEADPLSLELALRVYREMPCYGNTMYIQSHFRSFSAREKAVLWQAYREALDSDDDRLADPMAYSLWVDYFEDMDSVDEAWVECSRRDRHPWRRRLQRILSKAGPVPWRLKAPLLEELVVDRAWHRHIFQALAGSAVDVYGQIDAVHARHLLLRLELDDDLPRAELEQRIDQAAAP